MTISVKATAPALCLLVTLALPAHAQEMCKLEGDTSNVMRAETLLGPEACETWCRDEVENCVGWQIQPHNISPDTVATTCLAFDRIDGPFENDTWYCGTIED